MLIETCISYQFALLTEVIFSGFGLNYNSLNVNAFFISAYV